MARKRFLSPDIWSDAFITRLSPQERLLFIGMITLADDEGRLRAEPSYLKGEIFPKDELSESEVAALRDRLARRKSSVYLYKIAGMSFVYLPRWFKYQAPSHPSPSRLPLPPRFKNDQNHPEGFAKVSGDMHDLGMGVGGGLGSDQGSESTPPIVPPKGGTGNLPIFRLVSLADQSAEALESWNGILQGLKSKVTKPNWETWLKHTEGFVIEGDKVVVLAPSEEAADYLSTKLRPVCAKEASQWRERLTEIEFVVVPD